MNYLILSSIVGALGLICATIAVLWWRERSALRAEQRWYTREKIVGESALQRLVKERDDARAQRDRLNSTCAMLKKELIEVSRDFDQYIGKNATLEAQVEALAKTVTMLSEENGMLAHEVEYKTRPISLEELPTVEPIRRIAIKEE